MYVSSYLDAWPGAKTIGVAGLDKKRPDARWDFIYDRSTGKPETVFGFHDNIETILFEGFITRAVAWYHGPSRTLIVSDLLMNLPCTEQYPPSYSSASQGPGSWAFSQVAHPYSLFFKCLIYFIATTDTRFMRRDAKRVAEWRVERVVPCHGDVINDGGAEAWKAAYAWFLDGSGRVGLARRTWDVWMKVMRRVGLGAW